MKAVLVTEFGEAEVLVVREVPEPSPGPRQVRVKLHAAGVNPNEAYIRSGTYSFLIPELPYTPGFDGAGVIDALGEGVGHLALGDRVFVAAMLSEHNTGTYAQKVVCDARAVHPLPDRISYQEGAALGIPATAAYRALFQRARLKPGETVLIHGASGGVGLLAIQMARGIGARVIGTAGTEAGRALVGSSGATHAIHHVTGKNQSEIMALTDHRGPDVIIEFLANVNLAVDLEILAPYGRIVVVGNRGSLDFSPRLAMIKEADILGMALWNARPAEYSESLSAIGAFLESGVLQPRIGGTLPLDKAGEAHDHLMNKKAQGKIVLAID
jgi:NADPH:quinone reductase-like Zn-dependent oxidoreductase